MEFTSKKELYNFLIPVFNVKNRINNYYGIRIKFEDIWNFLASTKWSKATNLHLSDIVNDIITLENNKMKRMIKNEKK